LPHVEACARLTQAATALGIAIAANEPLARHTTFRIGGPADLYAIATTQQELEQLAELGAEHDIETTILGGGSNVLVSDAGVRGLVIANQTRQFGFRISNFGLLFPELQSDIPQSAVRSPHLMADSGVALAGLARWAIKNGWSGLEWAVSVPGTVGGAVIGNAGAHGGDIAGNLAWALVAYPGRGRRVLTGKQMTFAYRSSILKQQLAGNAEQAEGVRPVVLAAAFNLCPGDAAGMAATAAGFLARRRTSQPVEPSAGSIFRNPPGDHAGRLIDAVGLKGQRIGGAQISPRHANFIVNVGEATATDVAALMSLMRRRVYECTGIELIPEILLLGDWSQ